jgi:dTDP-4-dehydrorhamnose reductase
MMDVSRVLVLGSSGQLARHLREELPAAMYWGRRQLDLNSDPSTVTRALVAGNPSAIINAAAYTAVDGAESEPDQAWRINAAAPAAMARAAAELDVPIVHVSTDYVFDGRSDRPYREEDPVGPVNVYGRTKLAGELALASLCRKQWTLRTSWVFSEHGSNFVKSIIRLARERQELRVVNDQRGAPTYAGDLARFIKALLTAPDSKRLAWGLHHATKGPFVTWHELAREIVARATEFGVINRLPIVVPISSAEYATTARRPANSALAMRAGLESQYPGAFDWRAGLGRTIPSLRTN